MSAPGLTSEAQLRYILQWFGEFSELQREDFLPVLAAARGDQPDQLAAVLANISCHDKPVSLFQCRVSTKLLMFVKTYCFKYIFLCVIYLHTLDCIINITLRVLGAEHD